MPRHQTIFKEVKVKIKLILKNSKIKKIVVGPYENCRHKYKPGTILVKGETANGFKLSGYDGSGVMRFYLYLKDIADKEEIKEYLEKFK